MKVIRIERQPRPEQQDGDVLCVRCGKSLILEFEYIWDHYSGWEVDGSCYCSWPCLPEEARTLAVLEELSK